jgi:4-carboxymuconolactone decarboxylase
MNSCVDLFETRVGKSLARFVSFTDRSRAFVPHRKQVMPPHTMALATLDRLDDATRALVRLSAVVAAGSEQEIREMMSTSAAVVPPVWIEELLLQTYLFAGFPRALNAMREWRRLQPVAATNSAPGNVEQWQSDGEATCSAVYGTMYDRLRENIRALHPQLDDWMIKEGYGKVLSRPELDLQRRELCIVAACAAQEQDRQLHSHLRGALNVGVAPAVVTAAIDSLGDVLGAGRLQSVRLLWARVQGK